MHAGQRDPTPGGLQPGDPAARGRDADRAAGVGAERDVGLAAGDDHGRAAGRAAGHQRRVERVHRRAERLVDAARRPSTARSGVVLPTIRPPARRTAATHGASAAAGRVRGGQRAGPGRQAGDVDRVLDRDPRTVRRPARPAGPPSRRSGAPAPVSPPAGAGRLAVGHLDQHALQLGQPQVDHVRRARPGPPGRARPSPRSPRAGCPARAGTSLIVDSHDSVVSGSSRTSPAPRPATRRATGRPR